MENYKHLIIHMAVYQWKRRWMTIDRYIIYVDTMDIEKMNKFLSVIGQNINQIANRIGTGSLTYQTDCGGIPKKPN